ncbi:Apoptogenic protein 1, mitochondrial [Savitreella phatthalungensis]
MLRRSVCLGCAGHLAQGSSRRAFSTVGRPDPVSNIRIVRYDCDPRQPLSKSRLEARRLQATKEWHRYWTRHNTTYESALQELKDKYEPGSIPSDELSDFYKRQLEQSLPAHKAFNRWWLRENFSMLFESVRIRLGLTRLSRQEPGFFGDGER